MISPAMPRSASCHIRPASRPRCGQSVRLADSLEESPERRIGNSRVRSIQRVRRKARLRQQRDRVGPELPDQRRQLRQPTHVLGRLGWNGRRRYGFEPCLYRSEHQDSSLSFDVGASLAQRQRAVLIHVKKGESVGLDRLRAAFARTAAPTDCPGERRPAAEHAGVEKWQDDARCFAHCSRREIARWRAMGLSSTRSAVVADEGPRAAWIACSGSLRRSRAPGSGRRRKGDRGLAWRSCGRAVQCRRTHVCHRGQLRPLRVVAGIGYASRPRRGLPRLRLALRCQDWLRDGSARAVHRYLQGRDRRIRGSWSQPPQHPAAAVHEPEGPSRGRMPECAAPS